MNITENITIASPVGPRVYIVRHRDTADFRQFLRRMDTIMLNMAAAAKVTASTRSSEVEEITSQPLYDTLPETLDYRQEQICCSVLFVLIILAVLLVKIFRQFILPRMQNPLPATGDEPEKIVEDIELGIMAASTVLKADVGKSSMSLQKR